MVLISRSNLKIFDKLHLPSNRNVNRKDEDFSILELHDPKGTLVLGKRRGQDLFFLR